MGGNNYQLIQPAVNRTVRPRPQPQRRKQQQKRKNRRRRRRRGQGVGDGDRRKACSVLNPFCPTTVGCKQNALGSVATVPVRAVQKFRMTAVTDATSGSKYVAFRTGNSALYGHARATMDDGEITALVKADWPHGPSYDDEFSQARSVNNAVKLEYSGSRLSAQGRVVVGKVANAQHWTSPNTSYWPDTFAQAASYPGSQVFPVASLIDKPLIICATPSGSDYTEFHQVDADEGTTSITLERQMEGIFIIALDLADDASFEATIISDKEMIPKATSWSCQVASPSATYSAPAVTLVDKVASVMPTAYHGSEVKWNQMVENMISAASNPTAQKLAAAGLSYLSMKAEL